MTLIGTDTHIAVTVGTPGTSGVPTALVSSSGHMKDLGVNWLRWQQHWNLIETSKGVYSNLGGLDATVAACNASNINLILTVLFPPSFQQVNGKPSPSGTLAYAQFLCNRYDGNHGHGIIQGIELGNEDYDLGANEPFQPLVDTMNTCYPVLKKAYPNLIIGPGASLQRNGDHIQYFWAGVWAGAAGHFDYANFHFYTDKLPVGGPVDPSVDTTMFGHSVPSFASCIRIMDSVRPSQYSNIPIWCTEFGFPVNDNPSRARPLPLATQSSYLKYCLDQAKTSGKIDKMFIFTISEIARTTSGPGNGDGMSLVQLYPGDPTPAYTMVKTYSWPLTGGSSGSATASVTPTSVTFTAQVGGSNPATQNVTLKNTGSASGTYNANIAYNSGSGWLSVTPTTGTLAVNATASLTLSANISGLAVGTYSANVTVGFPGNAQAVTVTLNVTSSGTSTGLLPGLYLTPAGVSSGIFGTQFPPDFGNPHTAINTPQIQQLIKAGGFTVMRIAVSNGATTYTDAQIDARINAAVACGCVPLVILGHDCGWTFNTHVVTYLGNRCNLYEVYNEPDIHSPAITVSTYISDWNTHVPAMRAINPNAAFIGPALGVVANFDSYLIPWINGCVTSGVLPDGVSFHDYPCGSQPSQSVCATKAPNIGTDAASLRSKLIASTLGQALPICVTEWNIDYNTTVVSYAQNNPANAAFVRTWTQTALKSMVDNGVALACQFDCANGAENGDADLVDTVTFQPHIQYQPFVDSIATYLGSGGGSGNPAVIVASPSTLSFSASIGGSNPSAQSVTLTNSGSQSGDWSISISYDSATGSNFWLSASPANGTIAAGASQTLQLSAALGNLNPGTYTATVTYPNNGTTSQTVTFVVSGVATLTPLSLSLTGEASSTLSTANQLYTTIGTPASDMNTATQLGSATGWGELYAQGNSSAWAATGTIPSPSGHGFLFDSTLLEGMVLPAGTYTMNVRLNTIGTGATTITADIHVRLFKRASGGTTTLIADASLTGQSIRPTKTVYPLTITTTSPTTFVAGDKLSVQIPINVTTNTGPSTQQIQLNDLSTDTGALIGSSTAEIVTPGYQSAAGAGVVVTASPSSLTFAGVATISDPATQTLTLTNLSGSSATWGRSISYGSGSGWLSMSSTSGTIAAGATSAITITASNLTASLAVGTYTATITITSGGSSVTVSVTLIVTSTATGVLGVSPTSLSFSGQPGSNPNDQNITLTNNGSASGTWTSAISYAQSNNWLALTPTSGTLAQAATTPVDVAVDTSGLAVGTYAATINFTMGSTTVPVSVSLFVGGGSATVIVTDAGLNLITDGLSGANNPLITYVAVGTSTAAPQGSDTQLGNEVFRKAVTSFTDGTVPGELLINCYLGSTDAVNINIQEVGVFGGSSATLAANSGVMLARGNYSHTKTGSESMQLQLTLDLSRQG